MTQFEDTVACNKTIFFVAPYDGRPPHRAMFLAATKKMHYLLELLVGIVDRVVLINTNPHYAYKAVIEYSECVFGGHRLNVASLPSASHSRWAYVKNMSMVKLICNQIIDRYGSPDLVWCYNAYALESAIGGYIKKKHRSRFVLEFEDWHFARMTKVPIKPFLDWLYWRKNAGEIDYAFAVNDFLAEKMRGFGVQTSLLPGILHDSVVDMRIRKDPFSTPGQIRVGYFGGLDVMKGGQLVLDLVNRLWGDNNKEIKIIVTGAGVLSESFKCSAAKYPSVLEFYGVVDDEQLYQLMENVDVIINPHEVNFGVMPFKLMEAIATGRLVVSTNCIPDTPGALLDVEWLESIIFCERSVGAFLNVLLDARAHYKEKKMVIAKALKLINARYSRAEVEKKIALLLG
jgi:glycosyltransferase involved in cell wall biosynthesis